VFSTIGLGVVVKPDSLDVSGSIPRNWLVYLAIFAFCMTVLAYLLDRKDRGHFWRMQTLVLRLVSWPLLLLATSSLTLDILQETLTPSAMRLIADLFNALWWLVPADLLLITVQRFIWVPLELRTNRRIPTVFRMIVATVIFVLAGFGIVAFVLGKTITSLLATSGLLTLILGLALQSSLRDIIAGIMLNFERPFIINDMLRYNNGYVRVIDVSWRTTRLETEIGSIIALPNGKISESEIENATAQRKFRVTTTLMLNPAYPPETVIEALRAAGRAMPGQVVVRYVALVRIEKVGETFSALYSQTLEVPDYDSSKVARDTALSYIWHALTEAGINWNGYGHRVSHLPSFEPVHGQAAEPA
jgi:branched-chain amino acid transport system substrate-binding protein